MGLGPNAETPAVMESSRTSFAAYSLIKTRPQGPPQDLEHLSERVRLLFGSKLSRDQASYLKSFF